MHFLLPLLIYIYLWASFTLYFFITESTMSALYTFCASIFHILGTIIFSDFYEIRLLSSKLRKHEKFTQLLKHLNLNFTCSDQQLCLKLFDHSVMITCDNIYRSGSIHPSILACIISSNCWGTEDSTICDHCDTKTKNMPKHFLKNHLKEYSKTSEISKLLKESRICFQCLRPLHGLTANILHQYFFHGNKSQNCPNCSTILMPSEVPFHLRTCTGQFKCFECKQQFRNIHLLLSHYQDFHKTPTIHKWWDVCLMNTIFFAISPISSTFLPNFSINTDNVMQSETIIRAASAQINQRIKYDLALKPFKKLANNETIKERNISKFTIYQNLGKFLEIKSDFSTQDINRINPFDFHCIIFPSSYFQLLDFNKFKIIMEERFLLGGKYLPFHIQEKLPMKMNISKKVKENYFSVPSKLILIDITLYKSISDSTILFSPHMGYLQILEALTLRRSGYNVLLILFITEDTYNDDMYVKVITSLAKLHALGLIIGKFYKNFLIILFQPWQTYSEITLSLTFSLLYNI